jgi:aspartate carbamoyltransferase catalytic subunit
MSESMHKPEERDTLPTAKRVALLNRQDRIFHVILAQQFDRETIDLLCKLAEMLRNIAETRQGLQFLRSLLSHKRAMLYFIQPSTRTFLSFAAACQILGISYDEVRNPSVSSEIKGETEDDTMRVLSQYFNLIVMRHPKEGFAEEMAHALDALNMSIPIINGGSGQDQHPTQAMLDIYTLNRCFGRVAIERGNLDFSINRFAGKTIAFVGDLKRGRTVRSLAYLLCRYAGVKMVFIAPAELQIGEDILEYLGRNEVEYEFADNVAQAIERCDAIYMTRLQDEYDVAGESKKIDYARFHLSADLTSKFKPDLAIMHPLPRRKEIDRRLDTDPRAQYFAQVHNGMWMRAAIIAYIFNMDGAIIDHYQMHFSY